MFAPAKISRKNCKISSSLQSQKRSPAEMFALIRDFQALQAVDGSCMVIDGTAEKTSGNRQ